MYHQMTPAELLAEAEKLSAVSTESNARAQTLRQLAQLRQQEQQLVSSLNAQAEAMGNTGGAPVEPARGADYAAERKAAAPTPQEDAMVQFMGPFAAYGRTLTQGS